jgi:uncharacterized protein (DUF486 family)
MKTFFLLIISNSFMTYAWYGHLKQTTWSIPIAIIIFAFLEYCFMVPANRIGYQTFTAFQLKIMQEVISVSVFIVFAYFFLNEKLNWNYGIALLLILLAVYLVFKR